MPEAAIGAVFAACIAALVSLLGLIIGKEQKTSEFRQAWIDSLREEIAQLIAHANAVHGAGMANFDNLPKWWEIVRPDFVALNNAVARIRLRLNASETDSQSILGSILMIEDLLNPRGTLHGAALMTRLDETEKKLVSDAQIVLKREWRRVRRGEPIFVWSKAILFIIFCVSALYLVCKLLPVNWLHR